MLQASVHFSHNYKARNYTNYLTRWIITRDYNLYLLVSTREIDALIIGLSERFAASAGNFTAGEISILYLNSRLNIILRNN